MNDDLRKLYRTLGYTGPLPGDEAPESFAVSVAGDATPGVAPALAEDPAEKPPLDAAGLERLENELKHHPRKTLARAREMWGGELTMPRLREIIATTRRALEEPNRVLAEIGVTIGAESFAAAPLPPEINFPGMDDPEIIIDPEDRKFENDDLAGILAWAFFAGPFVGTAPDKKNFRFHDPQDPSSFIYDLIEPSPDEPLKIALFSDFGVGRYYSDHIAKQFRRDRFPYAIHLGDVYYAGRSSEFRDNFEKQINPILEFTRVFSLNSNHEMYSGGIPYFRYMDKRAAHPSGLHQQQGSYFCLRSERFQIIGIDTAFFEHGRYKEKKQKEWLANVLRQGRLTNRVNILLSADHPYEYGEEGLTKLLRKDLEPLVLEERLVDLWFWGNTHYCALFNNNLTEDNDFPLLPFVGSCIGHAGYPYDTQKPDEDQPAPIVFLETQSRFPGTDLRPDKGNNGYCVMQLNADGSIGLRYIDWMSKPRFAATLTRGQSGEPLHVTPVAI
ncbi:MAG: hypothetical protein MOB07_00695 [Acidobacteria bacterium]|nr:hypothetical protein [Acidobacteriota bacterium]